MQLMIRPEINSDYQSIYDLHILAFSQNYEADLVNNLRTSDAFIPELSIVALQGNSVVGHILFPKILIKTASNIYETLALAPMAVHPHLQGHGIGKALINNGFKTAKELGFKSVVVLGHPEYYSKFGFQKASNWGIRCPFEVPNEAFMAIELQVNALTGINGIVEYPKEFDM